MTVKYVLYHAGCYDGFGAAYVAWRKFRDTANYIPVKHGEPIPHIEDDSEVYIVDFCYPRKELLDLEKRVSKLVILDHHISAKREIGDLDFATFDMERSGAGLTWDYFNPGEERPWLINHIEDRDLWRFNFKGTHEVHAYLVSSDMTFDVFSFTANAMEDDMMRGKIYERGEAMLQFQTTNVEKMCQFAYMANIAGYEVPVVNVACSWSEVGNLLLKKYPNAPFAVSYWDRSDGVRQFSLRSEGDFDVSEICKRYGGGGHKNASGFQVKLKAVDPLSPCI